MTSRFAAQIRPASGLSVVDSRSVHERIYDEVRIGLSQGLFTPGQTLTTRGLAATFGTSEMPVREAIRRLVAEKYIVQMSNRSYQVPTMDADAFRDVISVRMVMERFAAAVAASKAKAEDVARLRALNDKMRLAIEAHDGQETLRLNEEFHFAVYAVTGSETLLDTIETLWSRSGPYLASVVILDGELSVFHKAFDMHSRLISAIESGDQGAAEEALAADVRFAVEWYLERRS
ncbi:GntR family transcriptional regulator [Gemmobacter serpentinus]|uniref:GntR family transcriptional regulator n=1 Tax=Gemmobacter serpentinus TaxID=2652247 RepID=UPI00186583A8|nr:GntR family transcriptional regulator [Gemmobacter serpentinus]